jgi:hypothetical protein
MMVPLCLRRALDRTRLPAWWATIAALKPVQIYWRPWAWIKRRLVRVRLPANLARRASLLAAEAIAGAGFDGGGVGEVPESFELEFLRRPRVFAREQFDWLCNDQEKLWRYHLHGFGILADPRVSPALKTFLVLDWIARNADDAAESWEPYPVSQRLVNWLLWQQSSDIFPSLPAFLPADGTSDNAFAGTPADGTSDNAFAGTPTGVASDNAFAGTPTDGASDNASVVVAAGTPPDAAAGASTTVWRKISARTTGSPASEPEVAALSTVVLDSMYAQMQRLAIDLEYHIQANHLFDNFKALTLTAWFLLRHGGGRFPVRRLREYARVGMRGLRREIAEQFLPDGGHYERSPMYHREMLHGLEQIRREGARYQAATPDFSFPDLGPLLHECAETLARAQRWSDLLTHPDGGIALFQDSALSAGHSQVSSHPQVSGHSPNSAIPQTPGLPQAFDHSQTSVHPQTSTYSQTIAHPQKTIFCKTFWHPETVWMPASGYFVRRWGDRHALLVNAGNPGPEHQPGHSHGDTLTFELSLFGRRVVVDAGCGSYQNERIRAYCRSTPAHSVPWISGTPHSETWGAFRLGRRARVLERTFEPEKSRFFAVFCDFAGNTFSREILWSAHHIGITDELHCQVRPGRFESLFHVSPEFTMSREAEGEYRLTGPNGRALRFSTPNACEPLESHYYPEFGAEYSNPALRLFDARAVRIHYVIAF